MKLIRQNCEIISQQFIDKQVKSGNDTMLEHSTIYLMKESEFINTYIHPEDGEEEEVNPLLKYYDNSYSRVRQEHLNGWFVYVTTNLKVLTENGWLDDLKYSCEPTKFNERRITVRFICNTLTSHNFMNRDMAFTKNSDYNNLSFIIPYWSNIPEGNYDIPAFWDRDTSKKISKLSGSRKNYINLQVFLSGVGISEMNYTDLIENGLTQYQARAILPNSLKTELIMTGFASDWKKFIDIKSKDSDPQIKDMIVLLKKEFADHDILY